VIYTVIERAKVDQVIPHNYQIVTKSDGTLVRVDVRKARKAMKEAMIRAQERSLKLHDES
jgi:hypothetical protein